jgi:hypothetical protein
MNIPIIYYYYEAAAKRISARRRKLEAEKLKKEKTESFSSKLSKTQLTQPKKVHGILQEKKTSCTKHSKTL